MKSGIILDPLTDLTYRDCEELPNHNDQPEEPSKHLKMQKPKSMELYASDRAFSQKEDSLAGQGTERPFRKKKTIARALPTEEEEEDVFLDELTLLLLEDINKKSSKEVTNALERLADLCSQCEDACGEACHMGAPASVVAVMQKWSSNKTIQAKGLRVFIALTVGSACSKTQKSLWMVGAMEAIINAMTSFPESRSIQFFGCSAMLSLLPCGTSASGNEKLIKWMGRRFVKEMKGVNTVISAMIHFEKDRTMQETGCGVLLKLATFMNDGKDRKMLLESGAVSAFSVALESHPNDDGIQNYTTMFMNFLSSGN